MAAEAPPGSLVNFFGVLEDRLHGNPVTALLVALEFLEEAGMAPGVAGDAIGLYGAGFGLPVSATRFFTSYTLFAMLVGYVAGLLLIPRFVSQQNYLALSAALGVVLTIGAYVTSGYASVAFIASLGIANAMMWPAIFPLAIRGLGPRTETGSALLIMAICGGALMPYAFGLLKERMDSQLAYALLAVPSYVYILLYGLTGYAAGQPHVRPLNRAPSSAEI